MMGRFYGCFSQAGKHVGWMSLNRSEQLVHDYIQSSPDERHYWKTKVQSIVTESTEIARAVSRLDTELWRYYLERSEVAPVFIAAARSQGLQKMSMKNLAEHLVRLWTAPRSKKEVPGESTPSGAN
jgi:hypothetical protein